MIMAKNSGWTNGKLRINHIVLRSIDNALQRMIQIYFVVVILLENGIGEATKHLKVDGIYMKYIIYCHVNLV